MTDLITRLRKLEPPNPVARIVLTEDDWPEIHSMIQAVEAMMGVMIEILQDETEETP